MDWASQPRPFRSWEGSPVVPLAPRPDAVPQVRPPSGTPVTFAALGDAGRPAFVHDEAAVGVFLRHALGLSAWKAFGASRWSLRVNPSSGNLHPTEAYVVREARVWHYAPEVHALEQRCAFDASTWDRLGLDPSRTFLVGLTSIHWREAWKYGERAFRYCQHDLGHAIAAVRFAAALCGWDARVLADWPSAVVAQLLGLDRPDDFFEAELEEPGCLVLIRTAPGAGDAVVAPEAFAAAVAGGVWSGRASQLSVDHVQWTFIDEVAEASRRERLEPAPALADVLADAGSAELAAALPDAPASSGAVPAATADAATIVLRRRSAVAFDGITWLDRHPFVRMLTATLPGRVPFDAWPLDARVHLVLFVHRVRDLEPGVYVLVRRPASEPLLRGALGPAEWTRADDELPLWRLRGGDCRRLAQRLSCDQAIAADSCFSLGMLAEFESGLAARGPAGYRELFWETGIVGQVLYLQAEVEGVRGTGIGCFYDDAVHEALGVSDHSVQSLYHFTVGGAVEDRRLTTEPGYAWERMTPSQDDRRAARYA